MPNDLTLISIDYQKIFRFILAGLVKATDRAGMENGQKPFEMTEERDFLSLLVKHELALRAYARVLVPDWDLVDEALQESLLFPLLVLASADNCTSQEQAFVKLRRARSRMVSRHPVRETDCSWSILRRVPLSSCRLTSRGLPRFGRVSGGARTGFGCRACSERSANEVWVVNHLSDSVSVIDLRREVVVETIQVGDRPGDVVFVDQGRLAFVSSMTGGSDDVLDAVTP